MKTTSLRQKRTIVWDSHQSVHERRKRWVTKTEDKKWNHSAGQWLTATLGWENEALKK